MPNLLSAWCVILSGAKFVECSCANQKKKVGPLRHATNAGGKGWQGRKLRFDPLFYSVLEST